MASAQPVSRRRERERDLVRATRALFDDRGMQDAPIEEIARAVGIARGLVYRHFSSKEELYVLTVTTYLDELAEELAAATRRVEDPPARLEALLRGYMDYCLRYPAFLDCCVSLMHRPARELHAIVSDAVWLRLGQGIAECLDHLAQALRDGAASGVFTTVEDADELANVLWTQTLGAMHLARIRVGVRRLGPGVPGLFPVAPEQIVATCMRSAMGVVGLREGG